MALSVEDIKNLRNGMAPTHIGLVHDMTLGTDVWLDRFVAYYLDSFIPMGGSKVKVLIGSEGSGKTHLLRYIQGKAEEKHYTTQYLSARSVGAKLHDVPNLYRTIMTTMDIEQLVTGLACRVGVELGYGPSIYSGKDLLVPYITEEGYDTPDAAREVRIVTANLLKQADLSPSFFTFAFAILRDRLIQRDAQAVQTATKWLMGEKLDLREKRESGLFEVLNKTTARRWLDSLLKLLVLSGQNGLLLLIDDLDVLYEKSPETGRFFYTNANNKDVYELFRQIIDDADLLKNLMVILSGRRNLIEDEHRGFRSYEALWMRLQTGLVPSEAFNSLCDIVDVDKHLKALGAEFPSKLSNHLTDVFNQYGIKRKYRSDAAMNQPPVLKSTVINNVFTTNIEDGVEV